MKKYRYGSFKKDEEPLFGQTLESVEKMGPRIVVDFKRKRYYLQRIYPVSNRSWSNFLMRPIVVVSWR
jgi:hypothetical protein